MRRIGDQSGPWSSCLRRAFSCLRRGARAEDAGATERSERQADTRNEPEDAVQAVGPWRWRLVGWGQRGVRCARGCHGRAVATRVSRGSKRTHPRINNKKGRLPGTGDEEIFQSAHHATMLFG